MDIVTGSSGYIGSKLVQKLDGRTFDHQNGSDILDSQKVLEAFRGCSKVFHLAAVVSKLASVENRSRALSVNVQGTLNVLEACRKLDISKLVNVSTSEVLGDPVYTPTDEKHPCNPKNTYGISKLAAELLCQEYAMSYGLKVVVARPFMVYGFDDFRSLKYASAVSKFIHAALTGERPIVFRGCSRSWIHVDDCVDALILLGEKADHGVYDVCVPSYQSLTMTELAREVLSLCGRSYVNADCEAPVGDTRVKLPSGDKMRLEFDWQPKHNLVADLPLMIQNYKKHMETELYATR